MKIFTQKSTPLSSICNVKFDQIKEGINEALIMSLVNFTIIPSNVVAILWTLSYSRE